MTFFFDNNMFSMFVTDICKSIPNKFCSVQGYYTSLLPQGSIGEIFPSGFCHQNYNLVLWQKKGQLLFITGLKKIKIEELSLNFTYLNTFR
jgi:hypothetical protein